MSSVSSYSFASGCTILASSRLPVSMGNLHLHRNPSPGRPWWRPVIAATIRQVLVPRTHPLVAIGLRRLAMSVSRSSADVPSHHPRGPLAGPSTQRRWLLPTVILSVAILGIGSIVGWRLTSASGSRGGCSGQQEIFFVAVAPAEFSTLNGLARQWNGTNPAYQGRCVAAAVVPKDPSQV